MNTTPRIPDADIAAVRDGYAASGENFRYLPVNPSLGYYVETWENQCLTGAKLTPAQPAPVSLDSSDDEITEHEARIRGWIGDEAHGIVTATIATGAPHGWTVAGSQYFEDWFEVEFGASVVVFRIQAAS